MSLAQGLLALVTIIVSNTAVYLIARREHSGRIETSEAASLWKTQGEIRVEAVTRADTLEGRMEELRTELAKAYRRIAVLEAQLGVVSDE